MACLKCGSSWTTLRGKDMSSCPECCKTQRAKARRLGRLPASETKTCERCGVQFDAVGGNAIARVKHCSTCGPIVRAEYLVNRKTEIASGVRTVVPTPKRGVRLCVKCGKQLRANQEKYCGSVCYSEARKDGSQPWDRTAQLESVWHRGGRWACPPSRKPMQEMMNNMGLFLAKVQNLYARASRPALVCEVCSQPCHSGLRFCSLACMGRNTRQMPCKRCGQPATAKGSNSSATCLKCQQQAKAEAKRRAKQKYGRNHRQRARHHGVKYVAFPVRDIYERDGYRCQLCGKAVLPKAAYRKRDGKIHPRSPTIDHIVPMCRGGNHEPDNCQTACFQCNTIKSDRGGGQLRLAINLDCSPLGRGQKWQAT